MRPPPCPCRQQITAQLDRRGLLGGGVSLTTNQRFNQAALAGQLAATGPLIFLLALFLAYLVMAAQFNSWRYPDLPPPPGPPRPGRSAPPAVSSWAAGWTSSASWACSCSSGCPRRTPSCTSTSSSSVSGKMPFKDALMEAAKLRFRPIVMTTMTVLVISFPLIFGRGQGSEYGQRMGIVMFGGILLSAILTFFVVPAAFYLFERKRVAEDGRARRTGARTRRSARCHRRRRIVGDVPSTSADMHDYHVHSHYCRHATGSLDEYARAGSARGLSEICFTPHIPFPDYRPGFCGGRLRMDLEEFPRYLEELEQARRAVPGITILSGIEADYVEGTEEFSVEVPFLVGLRLRAHVRSLRPLVAGGPMGVRSRRRPVGRWEASTTTTWSGPGGNRDRAFRLCGALRPDQAGGASPHEHSPRGRSNGSSASAATGA